VKKKFRNHSDCQGDETWSKPKLREKKELICSIRKVKEGNELKCRKRKKGKKEAALEDRNTSVVC